LFKSTFFSFILVYIAGQKDKMSKMDWKEES